MPAGADDPSRVRGPTAWTGVLALLACATLWSLNGPLIKLLNQQGLGLPALTIAFYRSLLGGLAFLPFAWPRAGQLRRVPPAWPAGSVLTFTLMTATFVAATTRTAAANAILLQYTSPIWVFLLSPLLLGERPRPAEGLALAVAMAGVAVLVAGNPRGDLVGILLALASGFGYGSLTVALRGLRAVDPVVVAGLNCLGSALLLAPAVLAAGAVWVSPAQLGWLLVLSLVQFALPYALFSWALQRVEAHQAALIVLLETVLNPLWTYLVVGETVPPATRLGGPLILAGVAGRLLLGHSHRGPRPGRQPPQGEAGGR